MLQIFSEACESKIEISAIHYCHIGYLTRCSVSYKWTFQILKRVLDKVRYEYGRDSLLATYISHPLLSKRGAGGIDGLASWPKLCAPLMVAFGPTDDQQVPPVTCCQWPPALTCHQSHFMSVWRAQWVHTVNQSVARKGVLAAAVVLVLQSSSALGIDSKIYGFPRRPW